MFGVGPRHPDFLKLSHVLLLLLLVASVMSDSVRPHRRQPTRLPRPWDSPGKNTGVGCHFLLQCMKVKSESEGAQSLSCTAGVETAAVHSFSAQGKQLFLALDTSSIIPFKWWKWPNPLQWFTLAVHVSLGSKPFIFMDTSLATDRGVASGSGWLWEAFRPKGWDQLLCTQVSDGTIWGPFLLFSGKGRVWQLPDGHSCSIIYLQLTWTHCALKGRLLDLINYILDASHQSVRGTANTRLSNYTSLKKSSPLKTDFWEVRL